MDPTKDLPSQDFNFFSDEFSRVKNGTNKEKHRKQNAIAKFTSIAFIDANLNVH